MDTKLKLAEEVIDKVQKKLTEKLREDYVNFHPTVSEAVQLQTSMVLLTKSVHEMESSLQHEVHVIFLSAIFTIFNCHLFYAQVNTIALLAFQMAVNVLKRCHDHKWQ